MEEIPMKVRYTFEKMGQCLCYKGFCPTFRQNKLQGGLFCSLGKSGKIPEKKGCPCSRCLVQIECGIANFYYCINGAVEQQHF